MGISFEGVSKIYKGRTKKQVTIALNNINLEIDSKNEFVALVGKTGSGKSTLIQHMNALLLPSRGNVKVFDKVITPKPRKNPKMKQVRKRVGFVFQFPEYQLFEETVLKDIMFAPLNFGFKKQEAMDKSLEIAKLLNIEHLLEKSPLNLSGGQMRKVAIAGILSYDPDIILLDEPTRGLDPKSQKEIMDMFYDIHKKTGKTIITISHDMNLVYEYATRVVVLNDSEIVYDGDKIELFKSGVYKKYSLLKPDVLSLIDYLNDNMNLKLDYKCYTLDELISRLGGELNE